jgi:DNA invertase Pin-like site-specific DNA recombinase
MKRLNGSKSARSLASVPLRVALYLRKSTEDREKSEDLRSTGLQESNARRYAAKRGWKVVKVYRDDNYSGALISRPDFDRLKADLGIPDGTPIRRAPDPSKLPFAILICRDQARLIRNADHAMHQLKRLLRTGIKICFYKNGEILDHATFKSLAAGVQSLVDSDQREQARHNVREGMAAYAARGYSCGGCCFGFITMPVIRKSPSGQRRMHTDYRIHAAQAKIVRQVFRMFCDGGYGARVIARTANGDPEYAALRRKFFNGQSPRKPKQGNRGCGSWTPQSVRNMVRNSRYSGVLVFGRTSRQEDDYGGSFVIPQTDLERIVTVTRPDLRIVPPALFAKAQRRLTKIRNQTLRLREGA